jgi:hypothetical protein
VLIFSEACNFTEFRRSSKCSAFFLGGFMQCRFIQSVAVLAVLAFSAPVFARAMSQPLDLTQPAMIGSTTLKPGQYHLSADPNSNQVRVVRDSDRKLVATVQGTTVTLHQKSPYGAVIMDGQRIHEIQFAGKTEAIELPNS